jgi:hypothetical protein
MIAVCVCVCVVPSLPGRACFSIAATPTLANRTLSLFLWQHAHPRCGMNPCLWCFSLCLAVHVPAHCLERGGQCAIAVSDAPRTPLHVSIAGPVCILTQGQHTDGLYVCMWVNGLSVQRMPRWLPCCPQK